MKKVFTSLLFIGLFCATTLDAQVQYEEQYDGSLNGWTSNAIARDSNWVHSNEPDLRGLTTTTNDAVMTSASVSNGFAVFNADFYTTQGVNNPGNDPDLYPKYVCVFISPDIFLTGVST